MIELSSIKDIISSNQCKYTPSILGMQSDTHVQEEVKIEWSPSYANMPIIRTLFQLSYWLRPLYVQLKCHYLPTGKDVRKKKNDVAEERAVVLGRSRSGRLV